MRSGNLATLRHANTMDNIPSSQRQGSRSTSQTAAGQVPEREMIEETKIDAA